MPGGCGIFSSSLERDIHYSHRQKVEPDEIERNGVETIVKSFSQKNFWYQVNYLFYCVNGECLGALLERF